MEERKSRRRSPEHYTHGHGRKRGPVGMPIHDRSGFKNSPQGRNAAHEGGLAAAAAVGAKPPAILVMHDPWTYDPPPPPAPVFGQYPRGLIQRALPLLRAKRSEVLHVCSGSLPPGEGIRVDIRPAARPDFLADGRALPFRDGSIAAVMLDPPYTAEYAQELYGLEYPKPAHLLAEAARVVQPGGRVAFVHFLVPYPPPGCSFVCVKAISTGCGYSLRAMSIFEKDQEELPGMEG